MGTNTKACLWARAYASLGDGGIVACPKCGQAELQTRFVGDPATRLGFGLLWCTDCGAGARLCRVEVPETLELHD